MIWLYMATNVGIAYDLIKQKASKATDGSWENFCRGENMQHFGWNSLTTL